MTCLRVALLLWQCCSWEVFLNLSSLWITFACSLSFMLQVNSETGTGIAPSLILFKQWVVWLGSNFPIFFPSLRLRNIIGSARPNFPITQFRLPSTRVPGRAVPNLFGKLDSVCMTFSFLVGPSFSSLLVSSFADTTSSCCSLRSRSSLQMEILKKNIVHGYQMTSYWLHAWYWCIWHWEIFSLNYLGRMRGTPSFFGLAWGVGPKDLGEGEVLKLSILRVRGVGVIWGNLQRCDCWVAFLRGLSKWLFHQTSNYYTEQGMRVYFGVVFLADGYFFRYT